MMSIALWLIGGAKSLASAAFTFLRSLPPLALLSLALALFAGWQTWRIGGAHKDRDRALAKVVQMTGVMNETNRRIADATKRATDAAIENKRRVENAQETARKDSDARLETIRTDFQRRASAYAIRMRATGTVARNPVASNLSGTPESPEGDNRPDNGAYILVSRPDLDALVENTARLVEAQAWVKSLGD